MFCVCKDPIHYYVLRMHKLHIYFHKVSSISDIANTKPCMISVFHSCRKSSNKFILEVRPHKRRCIASTDYKIWFQKSLADSVYWSLTRSHYITNVIHSLGYNNINPCLKEGEEHLLNTSAHIKAKVILTCD